MAKSFPVSHISSTENSSSSDDVFLAHSQPHIVSLQKNKNHFCGASIVSSVWLISASHCHQIRLVQLKYR